MKKVIFNEERCKSCELCVSVCPKKILRISDDKMNEKGYKPAEIFEQDKCIGCAFCATICPDAVSYTHLDVYKRQVYLVRQPE